jgi:hypothetical protein
MSPVPSEGTRWDGNRDTRDRIRRASVYVDDVLTCLYLLRGWLASLEMLAVRESRMPLQGGVSDADPHLAHASHPRDRMGPDGRDARGTCR